MVRTRPLPRGSGQAELVRWLWYAVAYLLIVVGLALLSHVLATPTPSRLHWFD